MILELYALFLFVSVALLFYGWYIKTDFIKILASVLLLLLAIMISPALESFTGGLEYKTGEYTDTTYVYGMNDSFPHLDNGTDPFFYSIYLADPPILLHTLEDNQDVYQTYTNHTFSFYLILMAIFNFIAVLLDRREKQ